MSLLMFMQQKKSALILTEGRAPWVCVAVPVIDNVAMPQLENASPISKKSRGRATPSPTAGADGAGRTF